MLVSLEEDDFPYGHPQRTMFGSSTSDPVSSGN
jgi:hypothetical protein